MLPAGLNLLISIEYSLNGDLSEQEYARLTSSEQQVINILKENLKPIEKNKLLEKMGTNSDLKAISSLKEKKIIYENNCIDDKKAENQQ